MSPRSTRWATMGGCSPGCCRRRAHREGASSTISSAPRPKRIRRPAMRLDTSAAFGAHMVIPTVIETGTRGERAYDLFSRLLRERIVLVNGPIDDDLASLIVAELL